MNNTYNLSISTAALLASSVEETGAAGDVSSLFRIRQELNHFLMNLNYSTRMENGREQIHFLFMALTHLENIDREIRISGANEGFISIEKIHDRIRSLKILILNYIKHISRVEENNP